MIVRITGRLLEKHPDHAVVDVRGIGYHVWVTLNTYSVLPEPGYDATLLVYHQIRENSQDLFGFADSEERDLFKHLITISGIGAKMAVTILGSVLPDELRRQIQTGNESALTAIHGVGPKTARRILVEMRDKFGEMASEGAPPLGDTTDRAVQSLKALGYKHREAHRAVQAALKQVDAQAPVEELIRAALRGN